MKPTFKHVFSPHMSLGKHLVATCAMASSLLIGTTPPDAETHPQEEKRHHWASCHKTSPEKQMQSIKMVECSLHLDSYTEVENCHIWSSGRLRKSRLHPRQLKNKRTNAFLVERKAEAKQNSAKMPAHEHLEASNLWLPKIGWMVNEWLNLYVFRPDT